MERVKALETALKEAKEGAMEKNIRQLEHRIGQQAARVQAAPLHGAISVGLKHRASHPSMNR